MSKPMPLKILGREIGTFTGWDGDPGTYIQFYDYVPKAGVNLEACNCLYFDEEQGKFRSLNEDGNPIKEWDVIETLKNL